jgi:hypothetical protein
VARSYEEIEDKSIVENISDESKRNTIKNQVDAYLREVNRYL